METKHWVAGARVRLVWLAWFENGALLWRGVVLGWLLREVALFPFYSFTIACCCGEMKCGGITRPRSTEMIEDPHIYFFGLLDHDIFGSLPWRGGGGSTLRPRPSFCFDGVEELLSVTKKSWLPPQAFTVGRLQLLPDFASSLFGWA